MVSESFRIIFRSNYRSDTNNIDEVLFTLKRNGATQSICTFILATELNIRLPIADSIVLNSTVWKDSKTMTIEFRNDIGKLLEEFGEE